MSVSKTNQRFLGELNAHKQCARQEKEDCKPDSLLEEKGQSVT